MAVSGVGLSKAFGSNKVRVALSDICAGAIGSVLSIAYCLSYAALIFTGPLERVLAYGVAVTFLSAAVGGAIVAWRSSLPFAIAGPDSSISVVRFPWRPRLRVSSSASSASSMPAAPSVSSPFP
jgi:sulfate permease, SulP family